MTSFTMRDGGAARFGTAGFPPAALKALVAAATGGPGTVVGPPPLGIYRKASEIERLMVERGLDFHVGSLSRRPLSIGSIESVR